MTVMSDSVGVAEPCGTCGEPTYQTSRGWAHTATSRLMCYVSLADDGTIGGGTEPTYQEWDAAHPVGGVAEQEPDEWRIVSGWIVAGPNKQVVYSVRREDMAGQMVAEHNELRVVRADLLTTRAELARSREAGLRMVDNVCAERDALQAALTESENRAQLVAGQLRASADKRIPSGHKTFLYYEADTLDPKRLAPVAAAMEGKTNDATS